MLPQPESACLLIGDLSGYTGYLAGVELDHAQDILADLMQTVVGALRPPFRLAKLEGDAAFMVMPEGRLDGALLEDAVEGTYFAFRRRLRDIRQSTTCECNACVLIPRLDLKFVVHHGQVARQKMAGREELVGRDVILVHRLLKNSVDATLGGRPYALYTAAAVAASGIDPAVHGLIRHHETIDVIGEVDCWLRDLAAAWEAAEAGHTHAVTAEKAFNVMEFEIAASPAIVWEFLTSPVLRPQWHWGTTSVDEVTAGRQRRGAGTTNHCMHGKDCTIEEVLDWRPEALLTTRATMPMPGVPPVVVTDALTGLPGGRTRLEVRLGRPKPRERPAFEAFIAAAGEPYRDGFVVLKRLAEERAARERETARDDPPLPGSGASYLRPAAPAADHAGHRHP